MFWNKIGHNTVLLCRSRYDALREGCFMKKLYVFLISCVCLLQLTAAADDWDSLVSAALEQAPGRHKRKTSSGKRLLREKIERIQQIDVKVPILINRGAYDEAEGLLKESLKLAIEFYGDEKHMDIAERFSMLGILYTYKKDRVNAENTLTRALDIGEELLGVGDSRLVNIYKLLAYIYYDQGEYTLAMRNAQYLLSAYIDLFGVESDQSDQARDLMKKIYNARSGR